MLLETSENSLRLPAWGRYLPFQSIFFATQRVDKIISCIHCFCFKFWPRQLLKAINKHYVHWVTRREVVQLAKVAPSIFSYWSQLSFLSKTSFRQNVTKKRFVLNMQFLANRIGFAAGMENISENKRKIRVKTWPWFCCCFFFFILVHLYFQVSFNLKVMVARLSRRQNCTPGSQDFRPSWCKKFTEHKLVWNVSQYF